TRRSVLRLAPIPVLLRLRARSNRNGRQPLREDHPCRPVRDTSSTRIGSPPAHECGLVGSRGSLSGRPARTVREPPPTSVDDPDYCSRTRGDRDWPRTTARRDIPTQLPLPSNTTAAQPQATFVRSASQLLESSPAPPLIPRAGGRSNRRHF